MYKSSHRCRLSQASKMSSGLGSKLIQTRRNAPKIVQLERKDQTDTKPKDVTDDACHRAHEGKAYQVSAAPQRGNRGDVGFDAVDAGGGGDLPDGDDTDGHGAHIYSWWEVIVSLFSIASYMVDVGTDVSLAVIYYQQSRLTYFAWTVVFIVLPSIIISIFSLRWYILDHNQHQEMKNNPTKYDQVDTEMREVSIWKWLLRFLCLLFQVAPLLRYMDALWYGWKTRGLQEKEKLETRKFFYQMMLYEDADSTLLRLFEAFMEAAPQLILQLYIMVNYGVDGEKENNYFLVTFQTGSVCMSLVSLAWSLVSYHKSLRNSRPSKKKMTYLGIVLGFCWRVCMLLPRVLAFALFASHYKLLLLLFVGIHWVVMTMWIVIEELRKSTKDQNFCKSKTEQVIFDAIIGIVWIFCCFNIREGHTRKRYIIYYSIAYIENVTLIIVWYFYTEKQNMWFHFPALIVVLTVFWLGIFFMLLYYKISHPEGVTFCLPTSYWRCCGECNCEKCKKLLHRQESASSDQELVTTTV